MAPSRRTSLIWAAALLLAPVLAAAQDVHAIPRRGDFVPPEVLAAGPVADYAAARLRKPPVGYAWYRIGKAYVMASVATGLITDVVLL